MLEQQNCTFSLNGSTFFKAWEEDYMNMWDLAIKVVAQTPQDHLSIDLMGVYSATSQGKLYALTAVCNLTGYLMTTPSKTKRQCQ